MMHNETAAAVSDVGKVHQKKYPPIEMTASWVMFDQRGVIHRKKTWCMKRGSLWVDSKRDRTSLLCCV